jgi:hypothetical protein
MKLNPFFSTTLQFEVNVVETVPEEYYSADKWEQGEGVYYHKEKDCMYFVNKYSVDTMWNPSQKNFFQIIDNTYDSPKVEERLLLQIVAASHGHNL